MERVVVDASLVRRLVASQFPQWAELSVSALSGGWDNISFRLGDNMVVRLPSERGYSAQVEKENRWLPKLAPSLPLEIPKPLALGEPSTEYPWKWGVCRWIAGQTAAAARISDMCDFATRLAAFLVALHRVDTAGGPAPGAHNFYRGGSLEVYDAETRRAIAVLEDDIDAARAKQTWDAALEGKWIRAPVWVHGDISPGNLLLANGD